MVSDILLKAREYEEKYAASADVERPLFHVTGGIGWINDPNGFSAYKGEYHLFYQYHPYATKWGPMHWGHVKTKDFMHWDRLPIAMAPDTEYDGDGCFSGGAVEMPDGRHLLMYTGVRNECAEDGRIASYQTQCIAIGDGVTYEKYSGNPVISAEQIPADGSVYDFRDPCIWRENDEYWCAIGNRTDDGSGTVLLYKSADAINWEYVSKLDSCHNEYGTMWECPAFFTLDDKDVLLISPTDTVAKGNEFHPGSSNVCILGRYDRDKHELERDSMQAIDYGLDFYAPQTIETYDGRRVMIGWLQNWATCDKLLPNQHIMGQMTIARELSVRNGRLCQNPVREMENYRTNCVAYKDVAIGTSSGSISLEGISGRFIDMTVAIRPADSDAYRRFTINIACDDSHRMSIIYEPEFNTVRIDRTNNGLSFDIVNMREFPVGNVGGVMKTRLIMDRYSAELFINDGAQAASMVIYSPISADGISFSCAGNAVMDVEKYDISI